jgi:hypothetical protein
MHVPFVAGGGDALRWPPCADAQTPAARRRGHHVRKRGCGATAFESDRQPTISSVHFWFSQSDLDV